MASLRGMVREQLKQKEQYADGSICTEVHWHRDPMLSFGYLGFLTLPECLGPAPVASIGKMCVKGKRGSTRELRVVSRPICMRVSSISQVVVCKGLSGLIADVFERMLDLGAKPSLTRPEACM